MSEFNVGDVVRLKSGGPRMTLVSVPDDGDTIKLCGCRWFDDMGQLMADYFPPEALKGAAFVGECSDFGVETEPVPNGVGCGKYANRKRT